MKKGKNVLFKGLYSKKTVEKIKNNKLLCKTFSEIAKRTFSYWFLQYDFPYKGKAYKLSGGKTGFLRRLNWDEPSPTLVTSPTMPATLLCHPTLLRPLSIEEYARIQQFPDNWKFEGNIETVYKQIGNAVPPILAEKIGRSIIECYEKAGDQNGV